MEQNNNLTKYDFEFNNEILSMIGRSWIQSDHDIIAQVFLQKMFSMNHMVQNNNLMNYYGYLSENNFNPTLIDAGGNIGAASLYFNKIFPKLKTISIEPDIENAELLRKNLSGLNVEIVHGALADKDGILLLDTKNFGPIGYRVGAIGNVEIAAYSIPSIVKKFSINDRPFILKIDIEGGEDLLFSGLNSWIKDFPLIIIELHDWMLPFTNVSKNFYKAISNYNFDLINYGENTFCFNQDFLK